MSHSALNLTARDFDAYAAEKATSNAYSRPRLEVKQRALAWARSVVSRLAEVGMAVDVHGSDEHPSLRNKKRVDCQWVFFWRDEGARDELDRLLDRGRSIAAEIDDPSPYRRRAFLALRIDTEAVEVCCAVHPEAQVDVENLRARLASPTSPGSEDAAAELTDALRALPEQFAIGVSPGDRVHASTVTLDDLRALLERAAAGQVPLWIGWSVKRETAIEHAAHAPAEDASARAPTLDEQLEDAIVALAPVYRLIVWSRENDRIALDRRIESVEQERARAHAEAAAQTERWQAEQAEARRRSAEEARARSMGHDLEPRRSVMTGPHAAPLSQARSPAPQASPGPAGRVGSPPGSPRRGRDDVPGARRPSLETLFGGQKGPRHPQGERAPVAMEPRAAGGNPPGSGAARAQNDAKAHQVPPPEASTPRAGEATGERAGALVIEKGVKVRVLSGPFADKLGVVGELDGRGGARVHLGLLSTRLEIAELEPVVEGRERPALQSSHRRPLAPAPRKVR